MYLQQPFSSALIKITRLITNIVEGKIFRYAPPYFVWVPILVLYPRPKKNKEDLYNREKQLEQFSNALPYAPLIVITGLRRTGKTSFLNVAIAESNQLSTVLDLRGLPYNPSYADFIRRLQASFNRIDRRWFSGLSDALKHLRGVSILWK